MLTTDPITGELRLVAPGRAARLGPRVHGCPFCVGNEHTTPPETGRVAAPLDPDVAMPSGAADWASRSFPNLFPLTDPHEVLVPTPRHVTRWRDLTLPELEAGLGLLLVRRAALASPGRYVHAFVNDGKGAGASLEHVHAQLVSVPAGAHTQSLTKGVREQATCALCALLRDPELLVERGLHHVIVAHPVPRMSGGLIVTASTHDTTPSDEHLTELASLVHRALQALPDVDTNLWIVGDEGAGAHWYLELQPRTANIAGVELALGLGVNASGAGDTAAHSRERLSMPSAATTDG